MDRSEILKQLSDRQRKNIDSNIRLSAHDLEKMSEKLSNSIFDTEQCSFWNVKEKKSKIKSPQPYIFYYLNGKKMPVYRLLYCNFIDDLPKNKYLKCRCHNKGWCCNLNHLKLVNQASPQSTVFVKKYATKDIIVEFN